MDILSPMKEGYWRHVHRLALKATRKNLGLEFRAQIVIRALLAIAVICALALWGSGDASLDEMITRGVVISFVIALFPLLYVWQFVSIPAALDKEKTGRIGELERRRQPQIELKTAAGCIWLTGNTASISVAVFNPTDTTIRDVFVELDRFVDRMPILNLPRKLKPRDEPGPKFDLPPRRTQYVILATLDLKPKTRIEYQFVDRQRKDVSNPGEYEIKLKAYGDGILPTNRLFPFKVSEDGNSVIFGNTSLTTDPPNDPGLSQGVDSPPPPEPAGKT